MPTARITTALLALVIVFMLATAPARLLGWLLPAPQVLVQGLQGSLWRGSATQAAVAVEGGYLQLGALHWELSPWSLLLLSPALDVRTSWGRQRVEGRLTLPLWGGLQLSDTTVSLDASIVKQWVPMHVDGQLSLQLEELELEGTLPVAGNGRLVWQNARWYSTRGPKPLGNYVAEFAVNDDQHLEAVISTLSGPIEVAGRASLSGAAYTVDARLTSEQPFHPELATPLGLMAAPVDGGFHLKMSANL